MHTQESGQGMKRLKNVKMRKILAFMVSLALMVSCMPSAYTISADEILGDETEELFSDDEDTSVWTAEEITPDVKNSEGRETEQQEEQPVENPDRREEEKAAENLEKDSDEAILALEEKILASCVKEGQMFAFFADLDQSILQPYQLDDKTFVEYHGSPEDSVTLYYSLDTGLGTAPEYKSEPLRNIYEGIFVKTFTLFYGETLRYYFQTEDADGVHKTDEKVLTMNQTDDRASSKYLLINQILCARKLEKEQEVREKLEQYLRQEQYVKEMFIIEKESER